MSNTPRTGHRVKGSSLIGLDWLLTLKQVCSQYRDVAAPFFHSLKHHGAVQSEAIREFIHNWALFGPCIENSLVTEHCEDIGESFYISWPEKLSEIIPKLRTQMQELVQSTSPSCSLPPIQSRQGSNVRSSTYSSTDVPPREIDVCKLDYLNNMVQQLSTSWEVSHGKDVKRHWKNLQQQKQQQKDEELKNILQPYERAIKEAETSCRQVLHEYDQLQRKLTDEQQKSKQELINANKELEKSAKEILSVRQQNSALTKEKKTLEQEKQMIANDKEKLIVENSSYRMQINELSEEKRTLLTQLSNYMNKRVARDELNLEDVSQKNRPMVILDEYELLCNGPWLEAKVALDQMTSRHLSEKDRCNILTQIIMEAYHWTSEIKNMQETCIHTALLDPPSLKHCNLDEAQRTENNKQAEENWLEDVDMVVYKFCRVHSDTFNTRDFVKEMDAVLKKFEWWSEASLSSDVGKTILNLASVTSHLAWKMVTQRPRMMLDCKGICEVFNEEEQELFWGSMPPDEPNVVVSYFIHPALLHGDKMMKKGKVFLTHPLPAEGQQDDTNVDTSEDKPEIFISKEDDSNKPETANANISSDAKLETVVSTKEDDSKQCATAHANLPSGRNELDELPDLLSVNNMQRSVRDGTATGGKDSVMSSTLTQCILDQASRDGNMIQRLDVQNGDTHPRYSMNGLESNAAQPDPTTVTTGEEIVDQLPSASLGSAMENPQSELQGNICQGTVVSQLQTNISSSKKFQRNDDDDGLTLSSEDGAHDGTWNKDDEDMGTTCQGTDKDTVQSLLSDKFCKDVLEQPSRPSTTNSMSADVPSEMPHHGGHQPEHGNVTSYNENRQGGDDGGLKVSSKDAVELGNTCNDNDETKEQSLQSTALPATPAELCEFVLIQPSTTSSVNIKLEDIVEARHHASEITQEFNEQQPSHGSNNIRQSGDDGRLKRSLQDGLQSDKNRRRKQLEKQDQPQPASLTAECDGNAAAIPRPMTKLENQCQEMKGTDGSKDQKAKSKKNNTGKGQQLD